MSISEHVDDVRAIVQRAVKDLSIEQSLKTYEEVWLSKIFELRPHVQILNGGKSTPGTAENVMVRDKYRKSNRNASFTQKLMLSNQTEISQICELVHIYAFS